MQLMACSPVATIMGCPCCGSPEQSTEAVLAGVMCLHQALVKWLAEHRRALLRDDYARLVSAFRALDKDGRGFLEPGELRAALSSGALSAAELTDLIRFRFRVGPQVVGCTGGQISGQTLQRRCVPAPTLNAPAGLCFSITTEYGNQCMPCGSTASDDNERVYYEDFASALAADGLELLAAKHS